MTGVDVCVCSNPESVQEMKNWNLQFAPKLLSIGARQLQPEMLFQTAEKTNGVRVLFL